MYGCEKSVIKDLLFQDVKVRIKSDPLDPFYGGNFDLRGNFDAPTAMFAHDIPAFFCKYVAGVQIKGMDVEWDAGLPPFFSHAIQCEDFKDIDIDGFSGGPAHTDGAKPAIALLRGNNISIRNCTAAPGTGVFVSVNGVTNAGLFVNNNLREAKKVCDPAELPFQESSGNTLPNNP